MESFFKQGRKCINYSVSSYDVYTQYNYTQHVQIQKIFPGIVVFAGWGGGIIER